MLPADKEALICEAWNRYYQGAYPTPLSIEQAAHLRSAFFAGASVQFLETQQEPSDGAQGGQS